MDETEFERHTLVTLELQEPYSQERRLISMDIDDEDDWGDIKMTESGDGEASGEVVDETGSGWKILNAYRVVPIDEGKHNGKFPMAVAVTLGELHGMLLERLERFEG